MDSEELIVEVWQVDRHHAKVFVGGLKAICGGVAQAERLIATLPAGRYEMWTEDGIGLGARTSNGDGTVSAGISVAEEITEEAAAA